MSPRRRHNGRTRPRQPVNVVYRTIRANGGTPESVARALGVSLATLKRWRRAGRVSDPVALLHWVDLLHSEPAKQLALARKLAGCGRPRRWQEPRR